MLSRIHLEVMHPIRVYLYLAASLLSLLFAVGAADAQLPIPHLHGVFPCGAKPGSTLEIEFVGDNFEAPKSLYFSHTGFATELIPEVKAVPAAKDKPEIKAAPAKFKLTIAPDVPPGE